MTGIFLVNVDVLSVDVSHFGFDTRQYVTGVHCFSDANGSIDPNLCHHFTLHQKLFNDGRSAAHVKLLGTESEL
jgi:hypothetical protein